MRIYVATKFTNMQRASVVMRELEKAGHTITHDWTVPEHNTRSRIQCATDDLEGVKSADAVVLLRVDGMRGAWIEVGAALAQKKLVIVLDYDGEPVFLELPQVYKAKSIEDVIRELASTVKPKKHHPTRDELPFGGCAQGWCSYCWP